MTRDAEATARLILETLPQIMQTVQANIRKADHPMPPMSHFRALKLLRHLGPMPLSDLAQNCQVSMPTMSHTVTVLTNHGFVDRVPDPADRRRVEISLTPAGGDIVAAMERHMLELVAGQLDRMPDDDLHKVREGFEALARMSEGQRAGSAGPAPEGETA